MGLLKISLVAGVAFLNYAARATNNDELFTQGLNAQAKGEWTEAKKALEAISPDYAEFPSVYLESQKLSYRLRDWSPFFAKTKLFELLYRERFACPELYLLHSLALVRNCQYEKAKASLDAFDAQTKSKISQHCSNQSNLEASRKQAIELRNFVEIRSKAGYAISGIDQDQSRLSKNRWPMNPAQVAKLQGLPLAKGLAMVGADIPNICQRKNAK